MYRLFVAGYYEGKDRMIGSIHPTFEDMVEEAKRLRYEIIDLYDYHLLYIKLEDGKGFEDVTVHEFPHDAFWNNVKEGENEVHADDNVE